MISSAYTYYLSIYQGQQVSKYDAHKRSELRNVYNNMLKINKKSPLYKIVDTENVQKYAIDLKESARAMKNVAASLTDVKGNTSGFEKKKAISSNDLIVEAEYVGDENGIEDTEQLEIKVNSLATSQINGGKYLNPTLTNLQKGSYFFDMNIGEYTYEFSFNVKEDDNNESIQDKLIRLFNRANIGINASKDTNGNGDTSIMIESSVLGDQNGTGEIFSILSSDKSDGNAVEKFGLNNVSRYSSNANFLLNGIEHSATSNTFSVKHQYQITLNNISNGNEKVLVGVKQDIDSTIENVNELISTYNKMVDLAVSNNKSKDNPLMRDISNVSKHYKNSLESVGFVLEEDGHVSIEESLLVQSAREGTLDESLDKLNRFKEAVVAKADDISIDPMKYVNKKLISYPNPKRSFTSPYISSIYSGMMFNGYI